MNEMLERKLAVVRCWTDDLVALGFALEFDDDGFFQDATQLEKCLYSLKDRSPRALDVDEDVELTLPDVMTVHETVVALRECLKQRLLDMEETIKIA
ncbi:hypothetical protein [Rhodanobacter sp. C05]|uniref:hypothetical protein n=1 Tax=Rhodanobacter sp. C05 TaxID=1945855 RepID=UPI00143C8334|nr:hypothetical protein [Rhodanobacter sp. C05]